MNPILAPVVAVAVDLAGYIVICAARRIVDGRRRANQRQDREIDAVTVTTPLEES